MEKEPITVTTEYDVNINMEEGIEVVRENGLILAQFYRYEGIIKCGDKSFEVEIKNLIPYLREKRILVDNAAYWYIYEDCSGHLEVDGLEIASFDGYTSEVRFPPQNNWIMTGIRGLEGVKEYIRRKLNLQVETNVCV